MHVLLYTVLSGRGRGDSSVKVTGAIIAHFCFARDSLQDIVNNDENVAVILSFFL